MLCVLLRSVLFFLIFIVPAFFIFSSLIRTPLGGRQKNGEEKKPIAFTVTSCPMFAAPSTYLWGKLFYLVVFHIIESKVVLVCLFLHFKHKYSYTDLMVIFSINSLS